MRRRPDSSAPRCFFPCFFRGAATSTSTAPPAPAAAARRESDGYDAMLEEIERWERLSADEIDQFRDKASGCSTSS